MLRGIRAARRLALVSSVSMIALGVGAASAQETGADGARWSAHGSVTARGGTERHIGELDLFVPLWQSDSSMLYGDLRAQTDDAGNQEGNVGLGFRRMGEDWVLGGYGFFDSRLSDETGNSFMQGTLGVEAFTETLDLRANVYLPESDEQVANSATVVELVGSSLQMRAGFERALPGGDAEVGYRLWNSGDGGKEIRAFAGGYYFDAADYSTVAGGRGRIEARLFDIEALGEGSRLTFGAEVTQDSLRDTQGFAIARLTIPFGGGRRSGRGGLDRRMTDYVVRDVDIITAAATLGTAETVTYAHSGVAAGTVTVLTGVSDIVAATAGGGVGDLFILTGSAGAFNTTATTALQDGQTLLGGGGSVAMVGANSGARTTYTAPGTRATVNSTVAGGAVIALANNAAVIDLGINNLSTLSNSYGISGTTVTGASVTGNSITTAGASGFGVYLNGGSSNTVSGNFVATGGAGASGVYLTNATDTIVSNNSIWTYGTSGRGIYLNGGSANAIRNNSIWTNGQNGYGVFLSLTTGNIVSGNNITTNGLSGYGVRLDGGFNTVSNNNITTNGNSSLGVYLAGVTDNTVSNNSIATYGQNSSGIIFGDGSDSNTVSGNSITTDGSGSFGIILYGSSFNRIDNNVIATGSADAAGVNLGAVEILQPASNTGTGNSYTGPASACVVDASVTGTNSINLCP